MKTFVKVIKEINESLNNLIIFDNILNSLIIFLSVYLVLAVFNFYPIAALAPALIYLIIVSYIRMASSKARIVESKYTMLNEKLRTAADNVALENPVVDALQEEVTEEIKKVRVSSFFNQKKTSLKILASVILCFLIVFASTLNLSFLDFRVLVDSIEIMRKESATDIMEGGEIPSAGVSEERDIYGEESIAILGDEEMEIEIRAVSYEVNVKSIGDAGEDREFEETFPEEVFASSTEGFEEDIPVNHQELVKDYFKELAGG